jgi:hypothetical protein
MVVPLSPKKPRQFPGGVKVGRGAVKSTAQRDDYIRSSRIDVRQHTI